MKKTIVFTGGHHNSALVVAKLLLQRGFQVVWFGHKYSMKGITNISEEYKEVTAAEIPFIELTSGKIHRGNVSEWLKFLSAIFFSIRYFLKHRPGLIVAFGGYLSVPPVIAAWLLRIPSVTHEQTTIMGLSNRAIFPLVKRYYLTWPNSHLQKQSKVKLVGLPMQSRKKTQSVDIYHKIEQDALVRGSLKTKRPLLLISGGKQGAAFINSLIEQSLEALLQQWNVLHQVGNNSATGDLERLTEVRESLPGHLKSRYALFGYSPFFSDYIQAADLIIGRSGAHTVYDIVLLKKKFLAIPLPFSYANEQMSNALLATQLGLADILEQAQASPKTLVHKIQGLLSKSIDNQIAQGFIDSYMQQNAAQVMVDDISRLLKT